jgi:hypothetical protein
VRRKKAENPTRHVPTGSSLKRKRERKKGGKEKKKRERKTKIVIQ